MSKFVLVTEIPKNLNKGEMVITEPNFMPEIAQNARKASKVKQTGINHLREVLNSIANKYDNKVSKLRGASIQR
jgi:ABC-type Zn2+ transport system substrate-binding protein/surface adhesin